ncbi:MAG: prepilin-type N-terminal cleavage/methylation domain-containing protein [Patescibacteria group bacterium]
MTHRITNRQSGLTLIELIVAFSIFILLALAAATLYSIILKTSLQDRLVQELQRDVDAVSGHLSGHLKPAIGVASPTVCNVQNADALTVSLSGGQTRRYDISDNRIRYTDESGQSEVLLSPGTTVQDLSFFPTCTDGALAAVRVDGSLRRSSGGESADLMLDTTITTRSQ